MLSVKFKELFKINLPTGEIHYIYPNTILDNCTRHPKEPQHIQVRFTDNNGIARSFLLCLHKDGNAVEVIDDGERTMCWNFFRNDSPTSTTAMRKGLHSFKKKMFVCSNCGKVVTLLKDEALPTHCQYCGYEAKNTVEGGAE